MPTNDADVLVAEIRAALDKSSEKDYLMGGTILTDAPNFAIATHAYKWLSQLLAERERLAAVVAKAKHWAELMDRDEDVTDTIRRGLPITEVDDLVRGWLIDAEKDLRAALRVAEGEGE